MIAQMIEHDILNAKNLAPLSISILSGSKLITSNFNIIQMMCPCRKIILSQIRMPGNAWEFKGTFLVKNVKTLNFWHKPF